VIEGIALAAMLAVPADRGLVLVPGGRAALAQAIPSDALLQQLKPQGHVNDLANLLGADERSGLEQRLVQLRAKTGAEVAVVTLPSLKGGQIDDFAHKLFQNWGIGKKGADNGVLLLVALQDRKARIEVGYGLEAILPDALAGRVLDEHLFPAFKQQRYADGLREAVERIAGIIERNEPAPADAGKNGTQTRSIGEQIATMLLLSLFVAIGFAASGFSLGGLAGAVASWAGVRRGVDGLSGRLAMSLFLLIWAAGIGVGPLVIASEQVAWARYVHWPLAAIMLVLGSVLGWRFKGVSSRGRGSGRRFGGSWRSGGGGWSSDSSGGGGGGFSSDFGGFGGGSSGGGGASGGW